METIFFLPLAGNTAFVGNATHKIVVSIVQWQYVFWCRFVYSAHVNKLVLIKKECYFTQTFRPGGR